MLRSAILLVRTSLLAALLLAASLFALAHVMFDDADGFASDPAGTIPSLAPLPKRGLEAGGDAMLLQRALFDPAHRAETIAGSIDDLRAGDKPATSAVTVAGVLLSGDTRKAMLSLAGEAPRWSGVGDERGGWRVARIDGDGAVLERDGQSLVLKVSDRYKLRGRTRSDTDAAASAPGPDRTEAPADMSPPTP